MPKQSETNATTSNILQFLTEHRIFAWRQNVAPIPVAREGVVTGFRSGGKSGISDIVGILPPLGRGIFIEVKTGADRQRIEQAGFQRNVELMGGIYLSVKNFEDFLKQWESLKVIPI